MGDPVSFMAVFQIAVCIYLIYCGITGGGQVFKDEMIHPSKREDYKKLIRLFCLCAAPIGLAGGVCDLQGWGNGVLGWTLYGLFLASIVILLVKTWGMGIDRVKAKEKKAKEQGNKNGKKIVK